MNVANRRARRVRRMRAPRADATRARAARVLSRGRRLARGLKRRAAPPPPPGIALPEVREDDLDAARGIALGLILPVALAAWAVLS